VPPMGLSRAREVKSVAVPVLARGDAEGLICKVALLEGELVEAQRAQDVARERERERESSLLVELISQGCAMASGL
jgi:hypothetical protein